MHAPAVLVALALILAPLGAHAADLVVWWEEGFNPEEDSAVREIVAAFEQGSGKQVELVVHPYPELPLRIVGETPHPDAACQAGQRSSHYRLTGDGR
jgi:ABC-type glycerol-3-phosphate transport system substrate-binding protein